MEGQNDILMIYLRVSQRMSRLFRCHLEKLRLTFPQALALNVLGEEGPLPISVLAERTGSANSTVSGIVDRLERLGLARRERSGLDRRVVYVAVTEQYQRLREQSQTDVASYFDSVLTAMGEEDRRRVADALLRLDRLLADQEAQELPDCSSPS